MSGRIFVVIFFFWALLTIITPALVHLSETSKLGLNSNGKEMQARRILDEYNEQYPPTRKPIPLPPAYAPAQAPAPTPTEDIAAGTRKTFLVKLLSESRRLLISKTRHKLLTA